MTLLEVMIALGVLAVGLLAMLAMQVSAMRSGKYGRHTTEAAQLARDQMEYLHRLDWGDAAIQPTGWTVDFLGSGATETINVDSASGTQQEMTYTVSYRVLADPIDPTDRVSDAPLPPFRGSPRCSTPVAAPPACCSNADSWQ